MKYLKRVLSFQEAKKIIEECLREAENKKGQPLAMAVVDDAGEIIYSLRMDGVKPICLNLAVDKAYTASMSDLSSADFGERDKKWGRELANYNESRFTHIAGGIPISVLDDNSQGKVIIGGFGISGRTPEEDESLAKKCVEVLHSR